MHMKTLLLVLMAVAALSCSKQAPVDTGKPVIAESKSKSLSVTGWGPQGTVAGTAVNPWPEGQIGMFFTLSGNVVGEGTRVLMDGTPLDGVVVHDNVITALLPATQFAVAGSKAIVLELGSGQSIEVGKFAISSPGSEPTSPESATTAPAEPASPAAEVVTE